MSGYLVLALIGVIAVMFLTALLRLVRANRYIRREANLQESLARIGERVPQTPFRTRRSGIGGAQRRHNAAPSKLNGPHK